HQYLQALHSYLLKIVGLFIFSLKIAHNDTKYYLLAQFKIYFKVSVRMNEYYIL
ncbi:hypothetical protein ACJX0J_015869, partial [Zea mays]